MKCCECGSGFSSEATIQIFCKAECRTIHNNRRRKRGALLYDLFMSMRWNPIKAKGVWSAMCKLTDEWKEEDRREREGRKSWKDRILFLEKRPYLYGKKYRI